MTGYFLNVVYVLVSNVTSYVLQGSDSFSLSILPLVVYSNVDKQKESIVKENRNKSGVYK